MVFTISNNFWSHNLNGSRSCWVSQSVLCRSFYSFHSKQLRKKTSILHIWSPKIRQIVSFSLKLEKFIDFKGYCLRWLNLTFWKCLLGEQNILDSDLSLRRSKKSKFRKLFYLFDSFEFEVLRLFHLSRGSISLI